MICYFSAGSHEDWRDDADAFDADVIGRRLDDWDGERWLDVRAASIRPIMAARIAEAASRGCDGVEPDNVDGWVNDTGFDLNRADQLEYNTWLAEEAHANGLLILLKNAPELVSDLVDLYDGSLNEECLAYDECDAYRPFVDAGKVALHVEYLDAECDEASQIERVCGDPSREGFSTLVKEWDLGAWGVSCD